MSMSMILILTPTWWSKAGRTSYQARRLRRINNSRGLRLWRSACSWCFAGRRTDTTLASLRPREKEKGMVSIVDVVWWS